MKFGVMLPHYRHVADPDGIFRIAQEAEAMGFHSVWVSDHVVVPDDMVERFGKGYYDMFTVLGFVASITKRVQLGTSIVIMPLRHPLHTAQVAATVDQLSKGRLILGVGVGVAKREFECLNASWEDRGAITDEAIQALRHAWTVDPVNFEGKFFDFSGVQSYPPTYQKPHPPIWVGGGSVRSLRRAAELGDAWGPTRPSFQLLEEQYSTPAGDGGEGRTRPQQHQAGGPSPDEGHGRDPRTPYRSHHALPRLPGDLASGGHCASHRGVSGPLPRLGCPPLGDGHLLQLA